MQKKTINEIDKFCKNSTIPEVIDKYIIGQPTDVQKCAAARIINSFCFADYNTSYQIIMNMDPNAFEEFFKETVCSFHTVVCILLLCNKDVLNKLTDSAKNLIYDRSIGINTIVMNSKPILEIKNNPEKDYESFKKLAKAKLTDYVQINKKFAIHTYKSKKELEELDLYPGDSVIKDKVLELEAFDFTYAIQYIYYSPKENQETILFRLLDSNISSDIKNKLKYYYAVLIDSSKLSELNSIEDLFLGAALCNNYNPITEKFDLIETLYKNFGKSKMKDFCDDCKVQSHIRQVEIDKEKNQMFAKIFKQ